MNAQNYTKISGIGKLPYKDEEGNLNVVYIKSMVIADWVSMKIRSFKEKGLSYKDIGDKIQINRSSLFMLEKGKWFPKKEHDLIILLYKLLEF